MVHRRSHWNPHFRLCAVVLVVTAAVTYAIGHRKLESPRTCTARAAVSYRTLSGRAPSKEEWLLPSAASARQQITEEDNLRRALASSGTVSADQASRSIATSGQRIRVTLDGTSLEPRISIAFTGTDGRQALRLVNQLAEQFAVAERSRLVSVATREQRQAHQATEQARRHLTEAEIRVQQLLARQAEDRRRREQYAQQVAQAPATLLPRPADPPRPRMVDNPRWQELNRQLASLDDRRAELLAERTPAHPEVQRLDAQIADLRQAISGVPEKIADPAGTLLAAEPSLQPERQQAPAVKSVPSAVDPAAEAQAARELAAVRAEADRARQQVERLARLEREAPDQRQACPQIHIHRADRWMVSGGTAGFSPLLLLLSLSLGGAVAIGAGLIALGLQRNRPVRSLAELQSLLPVPIIGVVSQTDGRPARKPDCRSEASNVAITTTFGTILLAVSTLILVLTVMQV